MKDKLLEHAIALAKIHGRQTAVYVGLYMGRKAFRGIFTDGKKHYVGPPKYFLEKSDGGLEYVLDTHREITKYFYNLQEQQRTSQDNNKD